MGMTREELEAAVGGEPGGGGMNLWSDEMEEDAELAALEAEIASFDLDAEYDPETGGFLTASGVSIHGNTGTKVIFRRLPPKITEEEFLEILGINPSEYNYFSLRNPYPYQRYDPESRSVAFVNFVDPQMADIYLEKFDGFMFIDRFGGDYYSTTTKAPCQAIPRLVSKIDPMEGTVAETEDYANFVRRFEGCDNLFGVFPRYEDGLEMCDLYLQELEERQKNPPKNESSPLVEYFREQRKLEKETGRRSIDLDRRSTDRFRSTRKINYGHMNMIRSHNFHETEQNTMIFPPKTSIIPNEPSYDECFPQLILDPMSDEYGQRFNVPLNKWASFTWTIGEEEDNKSTAVDDNEFDSLTALPDRTYYPKKVVHELVEDSQDKRKDLDRRERKERERKERRMKRKQKYEELKISKDKNSLKTVPEDVAENDKEKDNDALKVGDPENEKPSTSEDTTAVPSNSTKEAKIDKKVIEEKTPFPKKGNSFSNKSWEARPKAGTTKYGTNSYAKELPRRPNYDKKPQSDKYDGANRTDEKSWKKPTYQRNQRGWDKWSKDKDRPLNSNFKKIDNSTDDTTTTTTLSQKENEKLESEKTSAPTVTTSKITEPEGEVDLEKSILQKEKIKVADDTTTKHEKNDKIEINDTLDNNTSAAEKPPPKKIIVKKIIRVKKVAPRSNDQVNGEEKSSVEDIKSKGATTSGHFTRPSTSKKPTTYDSEKVSTNTTSNEGSKKDLKLGNTIEDKDKRVRKARPDIQIYRPGSWRQSCANAKGPVKPEDTTGNTGGGSTSKE